MCIVAAVIDSFLAGAPVLLLHGGVTLLMLVLGVILYMWMTPYEDIKLIRDGNTAAGIALGGVILGMAIPLAITLKGSLNIWDIVIWGVFVIILQMAVFKIMDWILRGLPQRISDGEVGAAVFLACTKLAVGAISAGAIAD
jgi:putative membrane protein